MPRTLIEPHKGDKRYVRRSKSGQFTEKQVNVGRSLSADRRSKSKTVVKKGDGDRGDRSVPLTARSRTMQLSHADLSMPRRRRCSDRLQVSARSDLQGRGAKAGRAHRLPASQGVRIPGLPRQAADRVVRVALRFQRRRAAADRRYAGVPAARPRTGRTVRRYVCRAAAAGSADGIQTRRPDRMAQGPFGVRRSRRHFPAVALYVPSAPKARQQMGARLDRGGAAVGISALRPGAHGMGAQHSELSERSATRSRSAISKAINAAILY